MSANDSATTVRPEALPPRAAPPGRRSRAVGSGTLSAALAVAAFSLSFPASVWALDGMGPWTSTGTRGLLAGLLAVVLLIGLKVPLPRRADLPGLAIVAAGCVIPYPLLTSLALQTSTTAHSAVVVGLLPIATAAIAALMARRRLPWRFWSAAVAGAAAVVTFALTQSHGALSVADLYLLLALVLCAVGYAEGGRLAAHLPGWHIIAWAIVIALPLSAVITLVGVVHEPVDLTPKTLVGLAYIAAISQLGGFVLWYRGMGLIGVEKASQIQLAQPLLTLVWSVVLMGEHLPAAAPITAVVVLACIVVTQRTLSHRRPSPASSLVVS